MTSMPRQPNPVFNEAIPASVKAGLRDPARLCPVLAGSAWLQAGLLRVRTATTEVEVRAPRALLAQVYRLCDGTRSLEELLAQAPARQVDDLRAFLPFLVDRGALVDASLLALGASRYAHQGSPFGQAAPSAVTNALCRRFLWNAESAPTALPQGTRPVDSAPLSDLFAGRVSTYTFDDRAVEEDKLLQFLWSVAGVVSTRHERVGHVAPRRTLASAGGMHLLQVHVVLQRAVGAHASGVYRVQYPGEKTIALQRIGTDANLLVRAFSKPWELSRATGAIFLSADGEAAAMRYRNRAMQYLFMEAGAALHNASLSAPPLGLGFATIGGYYEQVVGSLCGLDGQAVLGSGIFGPTPTREQVTRAEAALDLEFSWVDGASDRYPLPFHLARARVRTQADDRPSTWGRDVDPMRAYVKAAAEAVEREGFREPRALRQARMRELPAAVDPRTLVRYSRAQYARPGFPFAPFDDTAEHGWTEATDLADGSAAQVLAELVFSRISLEAATQVQERPFTQVTSSGCAAGLAREDAAWRALLEVAERDAFLRHWFAQRPGRCIRTDAIDAGLRRRLQALAEAGCRVQVQQLASPWAHVCLVAAQHRQMHFTTMGTSAHPQFEESLAGALEETEARVYAWLHGHHPQIRSAREVAAPEHHFDLYGLRAHFRRADAVLFPCCTAAAGMPEAHRARDVDALVACMARAGLRPLVVDITPARASIDQGRTSLVAVKALVPGLLPMSFGCGREPFGLLRAVHPAARFPHPFP